VQNSDVTHLISANADGDPAEMEFFHNSWSLQRGASAAIAKGAY